MQDVGRIIIGLGVVLVLVGLAVFLAWLYCVHPRLANPFHVFTELQMSGIPPATLEVMAAMLPIVVSTVFLMLGTLVAYGFAVFSNERRYLKIIDRLQAKDKAGQSKSELSDQPPDEPD